MLAHQRPVCPQDDHDEYKTDPEGYGLKSIGRGCGGTFYACAHCDSTLFIEDACRCEGRGYYADEDRPSRRVTCDCAEGDAYRARCDEDQITEWEAANA